MKNWTRKLYSHCYTRLIAPTEKGAGSATVLG